MSDSGDEVVEDFTVVRDVEETFDDLGPEETFEIQTNKSESFELTTEVVETFER